MNTMTKHWSKHGSVSGHTRRKPGFLARLVTLQAIRKERQTLSDLDPKLLNDIGLTAEQAEKEAKRTVWDAPERWLR